MTPNNVVLEYDPKNKVWFLTNKTLTYKSCWRNLDMNCTDVCTAFIIHNEIKPETELANVELTCKPRVTIFEKIPIYENGVPKSKR